MNILEYIGDALLMSPTSWALAKRLLSIVLIDSASLASRKVSTTIATARSTTLKPRKSTGYIEDEGIKSVIYPVTMKAVRPTASTAPPRAEAEAASTVARRLYSGSLHILKA